MDKQKLNQLDFSAVLSFVEVVERGSFTEAAVALNLTQPTVSQHIQRLERFLGVQLLHRKPTGAFLTEEGQAFIGHCRKSIQAMQDGILAVAKLSETVAGIVTLGLTPSSSQKFLTDVLTRYHLQYPQVHVKILEEYTDTLAEQVKQGSIDLAILSQPFPEEHLACETLYEEPIVLAIGASHPIVSQRPLRLDQIDQLPLVFHRQKATFSNSTFGLSYVFDQLYQAHEHRLHIVAEVKGFPSVKRLLLSNFGAAFSPYSLVQEEVEAGRLVLIHVPGCNLTRSAVLIANERHHLSLAAHKLADFIRDRARQLTLEAAIVR